MRITNSRQLDISQIRVSSVGERKYNSTFYHSIYFRKSEEPVLIQLPYMTLRKYQPLNTYRIAYTFEMNAYHLLRDDVVFLKQFMDLEDMCKTTIPATLKWISCLSTSFVHFLKVHADVETIQCFDSYKHGIPWNAIPERSSCRMILHLKGIWIDRAHQIAGLNVNIVQLQCNYISRVSEYAFVEDEICSDTLPTKEKEDILENDPCFGKYFKMIKMGIPINAIHQKLKMDNLPIHILEMSTLQELKKYHPPDHTESTDNLTKQLLSTVLTTSSPPVDQDHHSDKPSMTTKKKNGPMFGVSQHDILHALQSLRKTNSTYVFNKPMKQHTMDMLSALLICKKR